MKVALCLHGYFDSRMDHTSKGLEGYKHIERSILDKADVDVYVHSWQPSKACLIEDLYEPVRSIYEEQEDFDPIVKELGLESAAGDSAMGRSPQTILSHFYSIQKCFELVDCSRYDLIIKSRFDLGRINRNTSGPGKHNPYPVQCINFDPTLSGDKLYMANWQYFEDGPPDMWFYGGPEIMTHFKTLYNYLLKNLTMENINAIKQFKAWMIHQGIWEKREALDTVWE